MSLTFFFFLCQHKSIYLSYINKWYTVQSKNFNDDCHSIQSTHLRMEENFRPQKSFIAHINGKLLFCNGVHSLKLLQPFWRILVILGKLFCYIWAHVTKSLLQRKILHLISATTNSLDSINAFIYTLTVISPCNNILCNTMTHLHFFLKQHFQHYCYSSFLNKLQ